jgi:hypothetical protein
MRPIVTRPAFETFAAWAATTTVIAMRPIVTRPVNVAWTVTATAMRPIVTRLEVAAWVAVSNMADEPALLPQPEQPTAQE